MNALAIDCAVSKIAIAAKKDTMLTKLVLNVGTKQSEKLLPSIDFVLNELELKPSDLDYTTITSGPGSFTGIRIGLSIAKTMAYALKIEINTISSLTAYLVSNNTNEKRKAVIEDNKGYYISVFDENNQNVEEEYYSEVDNVNLPKVEEKLDVEKIIDYCKNMKSENPHFVKANYVKKIEVERHD